MVDNLQSMVDNLQSMVDHLQSNTNISLISRVGGGARIVFLERGFLLDPNFLADLMIWKLMMKDRFW